ncbi:MAG: hypothetical protein IJZ33_03690 [Clostridia bacterium]|nr:hypothetical protein [Clostridia bacterium]
MGVAMGLSVIVMVVFALLYGVLLLFALASYVISGVSFLKISKKLGVEKGWLSFIPIANYWLLGRLAEEDGKRYHPEKKQTKWGKIYLTTGIVYLVVMLLISGVYGTFSIIAAIGMAEGGSETAALGISMVQLVVQLIADGVIIAMATAVTIICYVILYKLYHVMAGSSATWMLILSILVPVSQLVLLLVLAFSKKYPVKSPYIAADVTKGQGEPIAEQAEA